MKCSAIGATDELAVKIVKEPVSVPDLFATVFATMQIDPTKEHSVEDVR